MGLVKLSARVLVDRYHRGAVVLCGLRSFAVDESIARLLDRVQRGAAPRSEDETLLGLLLERGWLEAIDAGT